MKSSAQRRTLLVAMLALIALASLALATSWAEPFWRVIRPQLPSFVVILASVSVIVQLLVALVEGLSKRGAWRSAALPLSLGVSALCMALAFLPGAPGATPRLVPIAGAALFALTAAALQRRTRARGSTTRS